MRARNGFRYIIKVFEAQWDQLHDESVKPFFEQLKRDTNETDARRNGYRPARPGHDALFSYTIFQNAEGLRDALSGHAQGVDNRAKIAYFACHGKRGHISAVKDIGRTKLKNILAPMTSYDGLYIGACDFVNRETAEVLLGGSPYLKWVAGYANWTPWLEGMLCDLMFFRLLLSGRFVRPNTNARWQAVSRPEDAAMQLYALFPPARDLRFSLFYRTRDRICSTLEEHEKRSAEE
ncbi:MAG: hypothetical protein HZA60_08835 [Deltaproteobacteria bacterium]|nr:hypothetical protein [Deltaproteobacteria bacterium]